VNPGELSPEEIEEREWIRDQLRVLAAERARSMSTSEINAALKAWRERSAEIRLKLERLRGNR
jgi:hypothetical protein